MKPPSSALAMALSTVLRLTSYSFSLSLSARCRPFLFFRSPLLASLSVASRSFAELRPLYTASRGSVRPIGSRKRDHGEETASEGKVEDGEVGNGGVMVMERGGGGGRDGRIVPTELHKEAKDAFVSSKYRGHLLFVSESGHGKRVPLSAIRLNSINRVGWGCKLLPHYRLAAMFAVGSSLSEDGQSDEVVVLVSQSGTVNRIKVGDIPIQSLKGRGAILMRLDVGEKIQRAYLSSASLISALEADDCLPF